MDVLHRLLDQLGQTWSLWLAALRLDPDVATVLAPATSWFPVIVIAVVAGIALVAGQSVVLLANQVRRWALVFSLVFAIAGILASHFLEGLLLWALGNLIFTEPWTALEIVKVVILSSAPMAFGFLTAIPLLGPALNRLLSVWSLVVLWAVVAATFRAGPWPAAALVLAAWLGMLLLGNLLGPELARLRDRVWRRVTGRPLHLDTNFLLELIEEPEA
ncbi:hypothetical protein [Granulicoccus sp. GXG6511]|uniref:hypothetical protein n=1 Tax=Granulicoccus sp. GXG6511 TaxID=3381351 RepID=UPI003D7E24E9